ncbi:MAG: molybdopterin-dependent oxidoreductase, partial [Anaerolineales bacterium]|nr:molybdopterin-dependent oxidoreductase [Anaerolineales bacterium]
MSNQISRRDFLKLASMTGGGLALAVFLDGCAPPTLDEATAVGVTSMPTTRDPFDWAPNIYLKLDNQGVLTVMAFRSEMGQGIRTALAMLVADELDVEWNAVHIEQVPADARYGDQVTGGSQSISRSYQAVRTAGATARQMLVSAAAQAWSVDPAQCRTEAGFVIHPDGEKKSAYGDLAEAASKLEIPRDVKVKEKS